MLLAFPSDNWLCPGACDEDLGKLTSGTAPSNLVRKLLTLISAVETVQASILTCRAQRAQAASSFFRSKSEFHSSKLPLNLQPPAQSLCVLASGYLCHLGRVRTLPARFMPTLPQWPTVLGPPLAPCLSGFDCHLSGRGAAQIAVQC